METMELASSAFNDNGPIPSRHSRDGDNLNPPLTISGVPEAARSLLLIAEDPDSPIGVFTHWLVWNLPPDTREVAQGSLPDDARVGMNGFGEIRYDGPCPPSGYHRYVFRLLALDRLLDATTGDRRDQIMPALEQHVLAEATLTGRYPPDQAERADVTPQHPLRPVEEP
jgi:Raf kinase inhibitor-like YbhB/YbcL family protein